MRRHNTDPAGQRISATGGAVGLSNPCGSASVGGSEAGPLPQNGDCIEPRRVHRRLFVLPTCVNVLPFPQIRPEPPPAEPVVDRVEETPPTAGGPDDPTHYDRITVRAITIGIAISIVVHILLLVITFVRDDDKAMKAPAEEQGPLTVTIAQSRPQPKAPTPSPEPPPTAAQVTPTPVPPQLRPAPAPVKPRAQIAIQNRRPAPTYVPPRQETPPPPTPVTPAPPAPSPAPQDFSEALAQRQAARRAASGGMPDEVVESDDQRANRIAKANIQAQQRAMSPDQDPDQAGGIFELRRTGLHDAEFIFNGWNPNFQRRLGRSYEVRQGNEPSIQIAVIRQMIAIIREQKPGDFDWHSHRLNRVIKMSARPQDQPELERFLMEEFYGAGPMRGR